jgi:serine/threonine protein kinase
MDEKTDQRKSCPVCGQQFDASMTNCPQDGILLNSADPLIGTVLDGRFKIVEYIGLGGTGVVYKCRHDELNRFVAVKLLKRDVLGDSSNISRFKREAQAASRLSHPNISSVYAFGVTDNSQPYIVFEYLDGVSLAMFLSKNAPLLPSTAIQIFSQISDALAYANANGVLHRDLKPSNVMILPGASVTPGVQTSDVVKVIDFGLAFLDEHLEKKEQRLTRTGEILGTLAYMSPERKKGIPADARSDVYSIGVMLYETVVNGGKVPTALAPVIEKSLADDPDRRYQTAAELKNDLQKANRDVGESQEMVPLAVSTRPRISRPSRSVAIKIGCLCFAIVLLGLLSGFIVDNLPASSMKLDLQRLFRRPTIVVVNTAAELANKKSESGSVKEALKIYEDAICSKLEASDELPLAKRVECTVRYGLLLCDNNMIAEATDLERKLDDRSKLLSASGRSIDSNAWDDASAEINLRVMTMPPIDERKLSLLNILAGQCIDNRKVDRAEQAYKAVIRLAALSPSYSPVGAAATCGLANIYVHEGKAGDAVRVLDQGSSFGAILSDTSSPQKTEYATERASLFALAGQFDKARLAYAEASEKPVGNASPNFRLIAQAKSLMGGGRYDAAEPILRDIATNAKAKDGGAASCFLLGEIDSRRGNEKAAAEDFSRCIQLSSPDCFLSGQLFPAVQRLLNYYVTHGQGKQAVDLAEKCVDARLGMNLRDQTTSDLLVTLATYYQGNNELTKAGKIYEQVETSQCKGDRLRVQAFCNHAGCCIKSGDFSKAISLAQKGLSDTKSPVYWENAGPGHKLLKWEVMKQLASAYASTKDFGRAQDVYEQMFSEIGDDAYVAPQFFPLVEKRLDLYSLQDKWSGYVQFCRTVLDARERHGDVDPRATTMLRGQLNEGQGHLGHSQS